MKTILDYIFLEPFPSDWLIQDIFAILLTLLYWYSSFAVKSIQRSSFWKWRFRIPIRFHIRNAAIVMGLYTYGRSLVMIGFVPASVPLIEACF
jgi:hypothetical protein